MCDVILEQRNFSKFTDKLKTPSSGSAPSKDVFRNFAKFTEKHFSGNLFFNKVAGCKNSHRRYSVRKGVLRNFAKFTEKPLCRSLYFNKVAGQVCNFIKIETLTQVFSCEFCEISKNTFFTEYVWATAFKAGNLKLSEAATGDFQ